MRHNQVMKDDRSLFIKITTKLVVLLFICLTASWARAADGPLSSDDVRLLLIGGKTSAQMVELIEQRGVSFRLTPELESKLHDDGADEAVIKALRTVQDKPAPAKAETPAAPAKQEHPSSGPSTSGTAEHSTAQTTKDQPSNAGDSGDSERSSAARERAESSASAGDEPRLIIRSHDASTAQSQASPSS